MLPWIEPMLYTDPQLERIRLLCPQCGASRYAPDGICLRCERRMP